jgi:protein SCO1
VLRLRVSVYRLISIRFAILALAVSLLIPGCTRRPAAAPGSYPAANPNDCLPALSLVDQHGQPVMLSTLKGKPVLIDFVYTSCHLECPVLTAKFRIVARRLGPTLGRQVKMVSISLDPEHDTSPMLLKYAHDEGADDPGWLFLTGKPETIDRELALFRIRRMRLKDGSIGHVGMAFLLGPDGHQLRQYDMLKVSPDAVVNDVRNALAAG